MTYHKNNNKYTIKNDGKLLIDFLKVFRFVYVDVICNF